MTVLKTIDAADRVVWESDDHFPHWADLDSSVAMERIFPKTRNESALIRNVTSENRTIVLTTGFSDFSSLPWAKLTFLRLSNADPATQNCYNRG